LKLAIETLSEDNIGWNSILAAFQNYFTLNGSLFSQLQNLRGLVYDSLTYQALLVRTMLLIYGHPRRNTVMPRSKFPLFNFYNTGTTKLLSNPVSKGANSRNPSPLVTMKAMEHLSKKICSFLFPP
jgi:hypothetical protein